MATSGTAGTFTCAQLLKIQVEVDKIWADNVQKRDYMAKVDVLTAIRTEQTATLAPLQDPDKDNTLKIIWPADCSTSLADCSDDCTIGGPEPEAQCVEMTLDLCKTAGFSVKEKIFRGLQGSREEYVAKSLAKRMKELDEYLAQTAVAKLNAFAGKNQYLGGIGDPENSGVTYIAPAYWTPDVYGYFAQVQTMNKFGDVYMLHGSNLYQMKWQAEMNNVNQDQKDQLNKMTSIRSYWDMFNIDSVNAPDKVSYMVERGAIAFVSKAYYGSVPTNYFTQQRWSIESKSLPGVFYDVVYTNTCASNEITHSWSLYLKAGFFKNPLGCDTTVTGIIKFICGENAGS